MKPSSPSIDILSDKVQSIKNILHVVDVVACLGCQRADVRGQTAIALFVLKNVSKRLNAAQPHLIVRRENLGLRTRHVDFLLFAV